MPGEDTEPFRPPLCNRFSSPEIIALFADVHRRWALLSSAQAIDGDLPGIRNDLQLSVLGLLQGSIPELPSLPRSPKAQYSRLNNSTITSSFIILAGLHQIYAKALVQIITIPMNRIFANCPCHFQFPVPFSYMYIYIHIFVIKTSVST